MSPNPPIHIGARTILGYHLVWTKYGWWLPNDPRGSMSKTIACDVIAELGALHHGRKRIQPTSREIRTFYDNATDVLKFTLLRLTPDEVEAVGRAFAAEMKRSGYTCYACAIMPDHVHALIRKHRDAAERMILNLQVASREEVLSLRTHENGHPVWGGPGWKVFLDSPEDVRRTIKYIENNPVKARLPRQSWDFITRYDGWSFGGQGR